MSGLRRGTQWFLGKPSQLLPGQVTNLVSLFMEAVERKFSQLSLRDRKVLVWLLDFAFHEERNLNVWQVDSIKVGLWSFIYRVHMRWPGIWASWTLPVFSRYRLKKGHMKTWVYQLSSRSSFPRTPQSGFLSLWVYLFWIFNLNGHLHFPFCYN